MKLLRTRSVVIAMAALNVVACGSSDPTGSGGEGRVAFTTWGEEYIEQGIPADAGDYSGFTDGWSVKYDKFLVNFQNIVVADSAGSISARFPGSKLFDNTAPGVKSIVDFNDVPAKAWPRVSYEIAPVTNETTLTPNVAPSDRTLMTTGAYGIYVEGTATKASTQKHFAWGFALATRYSDCHSEQNGRDEAGIVVTNNSSVEVQLTTHGDHLFYDRLQASPDPQIMTSLRFDPIAQADANDDGEVTLEELNATPLDVRTYDRSGFPASTLGGFISALSRTVGHFRGEGECSVSAVQ
ncbi:MAG: hypothetical protein ACOY0T_38010 [Myxococcota bacterium]